MYYTVLFYYNVYYLVHRYIHTLTYYYCIITTHGLRATLPPSGGLGPGVVVFPLTHEEFQQALERRRLFIGGGEEEQEVQ